VAPPRRRRPAGPDGAVRRPGQGEARGGREEGQGRTQEEGRKEGRGFRGEERKAGKESREKRSQESGVISFE